VPVDWLFPEMPVNHTGLILVVLELVVTRFLAAVVSSTCG
jgi:hypothetical protein